MAIACKRAGSATIGERSPGSAPLRPLIAELRSTWVGGGLGSEWEWGWRLGSEWEWGWRCGCG